MLDVGAGSNSRALPAGLVLGPASGAFGAANGTIPGKQLWKFVMLCFLCIAVMPVLDVTAACKCFARPAGLASQPPGGGGAFGTSSPYSLSHSVSSTTVWHVFDVAATCNCCACPSCCLLHVNALHPWLYVVVCR